MGFADGAFTPSSIARHHSVSPPTRHGRNVGFQQTMLVLLVGPVAVAGRVLLNRA